MKKVWAKDTCKSLRSLGIYSICAEVKAYVQALQREIDRADRPCDIEISAAIGYAWTDDREKKLDELLDEADKAMYEKKEKMKQKR